MRALAACSASISSASARSDAVSVERSWSFCCFVDDRSLRAPTSSSRTVRVWSVRARITAVSAFTVARSFFVFLRAAVTCVFALRDLRRDRSILRVDLAQRLHAVDRVLDAARAEQDVERRRVVGLVDVDEALVQHVDRLAVLRRAAS